MEPESTGMKQSPQEWNQNPPEWDRNPPEWPESTGMTGEKKKIIYL